MRSTASDDTVDPLIDLRRRGLDVGVAATIGKDAKSVTTVANYDKQRAEAELRRGHSRTVTVVCLAGTYCKNIRLDRSACQGGGKVEWHAHAPVGSDSLVVDACLFVQPIKRFLEQQIAPFGCGTGDRAVVSESSRVTPGQSQAWRATLTV